MLGQHYSSRCHLSSPSFGTVCSHYLNDLLHCILQHSPLHHFPSPCTSLVTSHHSEYLQPVPCPYVPSTTILFNLVFILLHSFHSQTCYPAPSPSFSLPPRTPVFPHKVFVLMCLACSPLTHSEFK